MSRNVPTVLFIAAPFLPEHQPALGVSSLTAVLQNSGISADTRYLNIEYGQSIGWELYSFLCKALPVELLLGEVLFTPALWGEAAPPLGTYVEQLERCKQIDSIRQRIPDLTATLEELRGLYDNSARVVAEWADSILANPPRVLGFTTTFQQNISSLALAKELRRRIAADKLTIVFGGANCEADMGRALAENFPFIDHVVSGEAEDLIVDLVRRLVAPSGDAWSPLPRLIQGSMVKDMDALPQPQFDGYFAAIAGTSWQAKANLVAESSRGCWWGMKAHCTFCGLNGATMAYRSKTPARFARELRTLKRTYGLTSFMLADNIMDMKYVHTLFSELAADAEDIELFYETKANLRKDQLIAMAAGGISGLQPGIESLSSSILKLMDKGTSRLQNVQLLKWSEELKIRLAWNLLIGFPGERAEDYDDMAELFPTLCHLPAPTGKGAVRLDRFSPYWRSPQSYGLKDLRPFWSHDLVYAPLPEKARSQIAYYFDYEHEDGRQPYVYSRAALTAVLDWMVAYHNRHVTLEVQEQAGAALVLDSRGSGEPQRFPLDESEAALLKVLDAAVHREAILRNLNKARPGRPCLTEFELAEMLERFLQRGWLIRESDLYLSVVLNRSERARVLDRRVEMQLAQFGLSMPATLPDTAEPLV
jgi:ribosomal peptide maturation radical SAM protein 1